MTPFWNVNHSKAKAFAQMEANSSILEKATLQNGGKITFDRSCLQWKYIPHLTYYRTVHLGF